MSVPKTSLSSQGYAIYKSSLIAQELQNIKDDLTIKPFVVPGYGNEEDITPYKLYKENDEKIYTPYYYGLSKYNLPEKIKIPHPETIILSWSIERPMRPYQRTIIDTYLKHARENGGGIISVGCGRGKTVMALKIAQELCVKTLILVHKEFLMNQWVERIKEYLPAARIGYIQGKMLDINHKDIVLAMIQSLSDPRKDKDYPTPIFESFGLVIADECHHLAAKQFVRSLAKYTFKYSLGLSATPKRADSLERVFKYYLGDIVYRDAEIEKTAEDIELEHIPNSTVEIYIYKNNDYKYCKEELNYKSRPNVVCMKSNIANCEKRTRFLLNFLPRLISEGRYILLLSCRREHIFQMEKMINDMEIPECTVGLYLGGMKQEDLDISAGKRVIIATFNMAEEAFDCKSLNTLIYMTPHNNIEQAVGRILRQEKKKRLLVPLIIDLYDTFSSFNKWNKTREKYYKNKGYPMKIYEVEHGNKNPSPEVKYIKDIKPITEKTKKINLNNNNNDYNDDNVSNASNEDSADDEDNTDNKDDKFNSDNITGNSNKKNKNKKCIIELDF